MNENKKKKNKVEKWVNEHIVEIGVASAMIVGAVIGFNSGESSGYAKGLSEFRKMHIDIMKDTIDNCAQTAAYEALNTVRCDERNYKLLLDDPDTVLKTVGTLFYDRDDVKRLLESLKE